MIVGIGCDVLHIDRIEKLINYANFLDKYFTKDENLMFSKLNNKKIFLKKIASNFCVKEAFFKAISSKITSFNFLDVEILRDSQGKPYIKLYGSLHEFEEKCNLHVTISNERNIVTSFVVVEKNK